MTDKQLDIEKQKLFDGLSSNGFDWYKLRAKELSCIDMINSILAYQSAGMTDAEAVLKMEEQSYHNYLAEYVEVFGRDKVVALIQGQIDSIDHIQHNTFTDSEGVTYNGIVWKEN